MEIIGYNDMSENYNRVFTLKTLRDNIMIGNLRSDAPRVERQSLRYIVMDFLGRSIDDDGAYNNIINMKLDISSDIYGARLREKYEYLKELEGDTYTVIYNGDIRTISREQCDILRSKTELLKKKNLINILGVGFDGNEPEEMKKRVQSSQDMSWIMIIFAATYNTYILNCIENAKKLLEPVMKDKDVFYTSARLLSKVDISKTGLAGEIGFQKAIKKWVLLVPTGKSAEDFNEGQMLKMASGIVCMKQDGRIEKDIKKLTDNDIVHILLNINSSFLGEFSGSVLEEYKNLVMRFSLKTSQFVYGI